MNAALATEKGPAAERSGALEGGGVTHRELAFVRAGRPVDGQRVQGWERESGGGL